MLRAVVADLHLGQGRDDLERFEATVDEIGRRGAGELVVLGDLFRAFVGYRGFWDDTVIACLDRLAALRRSGVRVVLVEGNRDFFLDSPDLAPFRDQEGSVHSFVAGRRRFLLEHGDLVNVRDRQYRFWRSVSKSGPARLWARWLPSALARRIVTGTESRLARTNFAYRRRPPADLLAGNAQRHFATGVDVVMWGHFHTPWRLAVGGRLALVVPAWAEWSVVLWVGAGGTIEVGEMNGGVFVDTPLQSWYESPEHGMEAR